MKLEAQTTTPVEAEEPVTSSAPVLEGEVALKNGTLIGKYVMGEKVLYRSASAWDAQLGQDVYTAIADEEEFLELYSKISDARKAYKGLTPEEQMKKSLAFQRGVLEDRPDLIPHLDQMYLRGAYDTEMDQLRKRALNAVVPETQSQVPDAGPEIAGDMPA